MANNSPWGRAYALEERRDSDGKEIDPYWHIIGTVWETEKGNLTFTMGVEPVIWKDPHEPRRVVLKQRDGDDGNDTRNENRRGSGRGNRR